MCMVGQGTRKSGAYIVELTPDGPRQQAPAEIAVPTFSSLHDLHNDIQACFGWPDSCAHAFICSGKEYAVPDAAVPGLADETVTPLSDMEGVCMNYYYDFTAEHHVKVRLVDHVEESVGWSRPASRGCPDGDGIGDRLCMRMAQGVRDAANSVMVPSGIPAMALMMTLVGQPLPLTVDLHAMMPVMIGGSGADDPSHVSPEDAAADPGRYAVILDDASSVPILVAKRFLESHGLRIPPCDDFDTFIDASSKTAEDADLMQEWDESFLPGILRLIYDSSRMAGLYFMDAGRGPGPEEILSWGLTDACERMSF